MVDMKYLTLLPALALLTACATPQEQCINTASNTVRNLQSGISKTQGNIQRGYAIHKQQQPYKVARICYGKDKKPYSCMETEFRTVETPVTINVADERRKLAQMKARLPAAKRAMLNGIASCQNRYPE